MKTTVAKELLSFIDASPSCYHAVANIEKELAGFQRLEEGENWKLQKGGAYYVVRKDSSVIAFRIPSKDYTKLRIVSSHSDSPSFKVKPNAEMVCENAYSKLNVEKYGGMLMYSWLDRPLSVAGRIVKKGADGLQSYLVNIDRDLLLMPSVAIHMNRKVNDELKLDAQVDTIPLFGGGDAKGEFEKMLSEASGVATSEMLGSDLFLYVREKGRIWGAKDAFISAHSLDDLACAFGSVKGFAQAKKSIDTLTMCCVFDNEEVGSLTGQGADSTFLTDTLDRINESLGYDRTHFLKAVAEGFMISADNAHAVHPNHPEYADPTNRPVVNGGVVLKFHAGQKYTTDGLSEAMFRDLCKKAKVKVQTFANRSNMAGGSTLGNIANRHLSIRTVDIGLPQLAMHSAYETAGTKDVEDLITVMKEFYQN